MLGPLCSRSLTLPSAAQGAGAAGSDSDADAGDADADAEAAERSLRGFGHLEDAPLDASLLVDVTTRLKPHQLIFAKWARDRPAVLLADEARAWLQTRVSFGGCC